MAEVYITNKSDPSLGTVVTVKHVDPANPQAGAAVVNTIAPGEGATFSVAEGAQSLLIDEVTPAPAEGGEGGGE